MLQRCCLYCISLLFLATTLLKAQHSEVKTYYDQEKKLIKEIYQIAKKHPGLVHGAYKSYYPNGLLQQEGYYRNDTASGLWKYYYQNGQIKMKGTLEKNVPSGHWEYFYENGNKSMERAIADGTRAGHWLFYYENGRKKSEGKVENQQKEGLWQYYFEDGQLKANALYTQGSGQYKEFYPSGSIKAKGFKKNGKSDSLWIFFTEDQQKLAEGFYEKGLRSGKWTFFHENGHIAAEGYYKDGKKEGSWKSFNEKMVLQAEGVQRNGKKEGYWKIYDEQGGLKGEGHFEKGEGKYDEYYESGKLKVSGFLEDDVKQGEWKYFYEDGSLKGEVNFIDGAGEYTGYYQEGGIKMKGEVNDNQRTGVWTLYNPDQSIAGYYKTIYEDEGQILDDTMALALHPFSDTLIYEKPPYKFKTNDSRYFRSRLNEFRGIIISTSPLAMPLGSLPLAVEYYMQERLGYELQLTLIRDPFFKANASVEINEIYKRGFSAAFRQKFYQDDRKYGMLYFSHELRFSTINYNTNFANSHTSGGGIFEKKRESAHKYEYAVIVGNRITKDAGDKGITVDLFFGVGIGYRNYDRLTYDHPNLSRIFEDIPKSQLTIPIRLGLNIGYIF